ncbi:hypothetical protein Acr_00g0074030 [Actinidia rufa]|uniref:Uncharacterized protein n=1 Tax=Actinidia rufa TaxID=165716 RepID=A0A7J0DUM8_9ERIC|nr:hypothetical protein Acr_00g0074030 [Actinidia rufa]
MSTMEAEGSGTKSKYKGNEKVDYDSSRFTGKVEEKFYNRVWVRNGAVIERELDLVTLESSNIERLQNFMSRGWISLTMFKEESILTLCQEFMVNIKYKPVIEKGKERFTSWVLGEKVVTPDTFTEVFGIPREKKPKFKLLDIGMPDLVTISHELLLEGEEWNGEFAMGDWHGKNIDLSRMMFMSLCAAHTASYTRGFVPFTGFLTELFKRNGVHIPVDLIRIEPKRPINRSSLSRSEGQKKKRRFEAIAPQEPSIEMAELKEEIMSLRMEMSTHMTALEEESSRHTTMLQEIKGMLIRMQSKEEEDDD